MIKFFGLATEGWFAPFSMPTASSEITDLPDQNPPAVVIQMDDSTANGAPVRRSRSFFRRLFSRSNEPAQMSELTAVQWLSTGFPEQAPTSVEAAEEDVFAKSTVKLESILVTVNLVRSPIKLAKAEDGWTLTCYTDGLTPFRVEAWINGQIRASTEQNIGMASECALPLDIEEDDSCFKMMIVLRSKETPSTVLSQGKMLSGVQINELAVCQNRDKTGYDVKIEKQKIIIANYEMDLYEIYGQPHHIVHKEEVPGCSNGLSSYFSASNNDLPGFNRECVICLSQRRDTLFLPCRHMCICLPCAESLCLQSDKCPICRQGIPYFILHDIFFL